MNRHYYIVTDGSAIGNPGSGGWAAVLRSGRDTWEISGSSRYTTISEMELMAAVQALRSIPAGSRVTLCSDSQYLIRGMKYLVSRWRDRGWINCRGLALEHRLLWQELLERDRESEIRWIWVRGHNGHDLQTRADKLAYSEARQALVLIKRAA